MIKKLAHLIKKAEHSKFYLWLLNRVMRHAVPFNKPHGFKIIDITSHHVTTAAPYRKKNFNHVRGIHACAIATAGELAAGIVLMYHFSPVDYRFIMSNMQIEYHYQAKKDITAMAVLSAEDKDCVLKTLGNSDKTTQLIVTEVKDLDRKLIATVKTVWQIKSWGNVKTKL